VLVGPTPRRPGRRRGRPRVGHQPWPWARPRSPLVVGVALASVGGSVTHAAVGPKHFNEATMFGVFFLVASALQAAWALLVIRRADRQLLAIGAAGNAAVLVLWAVTRTVGLPIGPEIWHPEAVFAPDLAASLLEVAVIVGALWLLLHQAHASRRPGRPSGGPKPELAAALALAT
jgi:peptidoglycan/LPS O-acetylase OafA/YrhL